MADGRRRRKAALLLVAVLIVTLVGLFYASMNPVRSSNWTPDSSGINCASYGTDFLVIVNRLGFNGSINKGVPQQRWPILCAHEGETVTINVRNTDTIETHGFAIGFYYEGGVSIPAGRNVTISFAADRTGAFTLFCDIFCSVHPFMQSGVVVVR